MDTTTGVADHAAVAITRVAGQRRARFPSDNFVGCKKCSVEVGQNCIRVLKARRCRADNKPRESSASFFRDID
jgi:hypothetical protein